MNINDLARAIMGRHRLRAAAHAPAAALPSGCLAPPHTAMSVPPISVLPALMQSLMAAPRTAAADAPLQTLIGMVLDESTSMARGYQQTIDGYNDQLATVRTRATTIGCRVLQVNFNSWATVLAEDAAPQSLVPLSVDNYRLSGGTALYDTVAAVVHRLLTHRQAQDENTSILLTILTDGDDTGSTVWKTRDMAALRTLMRTVQGNERWTVALAGPDLRLREFADLMSVEPGNVAAFEPLSVASRRDAMRSGSHAMHEYVMARSAGSRSSADLYSGTMSGLRAMRVLDRKPPE